MKKENVIELPPHGKTEFFICIIQSLTDKSSR